MQLNGKEIEITDVEAFFSIMDTFEKAVLSKDISKGIPESEEHALFIVSNHAIGLPKDAEEKLQAHFKFLE